MDGPATADQGPDDGRRPGILRHPRPPRDGHERAEWDNRTLVRLLSTEQLRRYAETTDRDVAVELIARERLRTWRRRDELRPTPEELAVLARPWRWARVAEVVPRTLWVVFLVLGWTFLISGILAVVVADLIWVSAVSLAATGVVMTTHSIATAVIDRMRTRPLLEWASHVPGQLGRGLPGSWPRSTVSGALAMTVDILTVTLLGAAGCGVVIAVILVVASLVSPARNMEGVDDLSLAGMLLGGALALGLLTLALNRLWAAMLQADRRRLSAVQWLVEG